MAVSKDIAFVAGATGFTGREVVRALAEKEGVEVVAHVRPDSSKLSGWGKRFEALGARVDSTAWEEPALTETLTALQPTHVFALLGTVRARMIEADRRGDDRDAYSYEAVDYGLNAMLMQAALAAGSKPRFVYLSAAGVKEGAAAEYYRVRHRMERELRDSTLPYTIARPSFITGPDRDQPRPFEQIGATLADTALLVAGAFGATNMRDRYRSTTNVVLAEALVRLGFDPEAEGRVVESEGLR